MRYRAYKPRTQSTLMITRFVMAKFRYFKKAKFYYFKQVVNLSATCFHVEYEHKRHRQTDGQTDEVQHLMQPLGRAA